MGILILAGLLFGAVLGQFFKWFILFPAAALAVLLIVASPANMDHSFLGSLLQFGALSVSLQVGYVFGLVILFSIKARFARALVDRDCNVTRRRQRRGFPGSREIGSWGGRQNIEANLRGSSAFPSKRRGVRRRHGVRLRGRRSRMVFLHLAAPWRRSGARPGQSGAEL